MSSFWGNIFRKVKENKNTILDLLDAVPILHGLSKGELKEFERIVHRRRYEANENIFWEGEPGVGMYIIQEGSVKIYKTLPDGYTKDLATLHNGDFFGELALLNESPRSASAVALETCCILGIFRPELFDIFERKPKLGLKVTTKLAQIVGNRLIATNNELELLITKIHKTERLAEIVSDDVLKSDTSRGMVIQNNIEP